MRWMILLVIVLMASVAAVWVGGQSAPPAIASSIEQKVASMLPSKDEDRWTEIPWRTDLDQARADAARLGKPLFMWIMDGHPLGYT